MPDFTIFNTWPLQEEIERRMGGNWRWKMEETEVDQIGYRRFADAWENLRGPNFLDWNNIHSNQTVTSILDEIWDRKLDESKPARLAVQRDLREGKLLAYIRGPDGLSGPIEASLWDGTHANNWLLTGSKDGLEIRVGHSNASEIVTATTSNGRFAADRSDDDIAEPLRQELRRMSQMSSKPDGLKAKCLRSMMELVGKEIAVTDDGKLIGPRSKSVVQQIADHSGLGDQLQPDTGSYKQIVSALRKKGFIAPR